MTRFILTTLLGIACLFQAAAQTQVYLLSDSKCVNRLEYRYKSQSGASLLTYTIRPNSNMLYMFDVGAEGNLTTRSLPKNTITCENDRSLSDELVRRINNGSVKASILRPVQTGGYQISPVASAFQVVRAGSNYLFRGYNFEFALDTNYLDYGSNLAATGSNSYVFFNGRNNEYCLPVYSFRREPDEVCTTKTDFDFIPGIGIVSERTGMTDAEARENEFYLSTINGYKSSDYFYSLCSGRRVEPAAATAPQQAITYSTGTPSSDRVVANLVEKDKELVSAGLAQPTAPAQYGYGKNNLAGPPAMIDCPEKPGEGYHIVQPGETLNAIARAYQVKVGTLVAWNNLHDPDMLQPCQKIYITPPPGGVKPQKDKATGKVVIATKPKKKSKTQPKKKQSLAPVTHSTETVAAAQPVVVQPQYIYWTAAEPAPPAVQYIYVAQPQPVPVAAPVAVEPRPLVYSTDNALASRATTAPREFASIMHTVQQGESLYSIAKLYGYSTDRFRKMNDLPENFVLQPGMQLVTSDCSCEVPGRSTVAPQVYDYQPQRTVVGPSSSGNQSPKGFFTETPVGRNWQATDPTPVTHEFGGTKTRSMPYTSSMRYVEHVVAEGETLGTIARYYNVSVEELATVNSLEKTDTLIANMRLMIPR